MNAGNRIMAGARLAIDVYVISAGDGMMVKLKKSQKKSQTNN
jgi:hypothetical protein